MSVMGEIKGFLVAAWAAVISFFMPIGDFMLAMIVLFIVNFSFGLIADIVNGGGWENKKALQFFGQSTVFFVLMLSVLTVGDKLHDHEEAISGVKYLCSMATYFFAVNISRNWKMIAPKGSVWYRIASFCYYVLSVQFVERIPFLKKFIAEKEEENNKD
jgi:hypothetical protein